LVKQLSPLLKLKCLLALVLSVDSSIARMISAILISGHYFLLDKMTAGIIVSISIIRFATCYFTTDKKYLYLFLVLNTVALFCTYTEIYDLIVYIGVFIFIVGNFQKDDKKMRLIMMV
jgi:hypothetical protein